MTLIDPDCRDPHKHATCAGEPCECGCHLPPETHARLVVAAADIIARHSPRVFSASTQTWICAWCSAQHGKPQHWPCPDRTAVGHLLPDASNALLPFDEHGQMDGAS